ncbi:MAG: hypothetical protein H0W07_06010 [Chloroflexi bacterium]|nr:hypothetical protein [Chloroflexota bacterium]
MDAERLLTALIGALFGAAGWLVVGLYIQRRQYDRQARNAARAVYFELAVNEIDVRVAAEHGAFKALGRSTFDRLLPELATWLDAMDLQTIAHAYMSHAGYEQVQRNGSMPQSVRAAVLIRVLEQQRAAIAVLRTRAFSPEEARRLSGPSNAPTADRQEPARTARRAGGTRSG